jgi:hypothetical protein
MKAKDLIWTQANGTASSLKELETSHLQSIAALLMRRENEYRLFAARGEGVVLPPLTAQGHPISAWLDAIAKILAKRYSKEMVKANALMQRYQKEIDNGTE